MVHEDAGPHHRLVGRRVREGHAFPQLQLQPLLLVLHELGVYRVLQPLLLEVSVARLHERTCRLLQPLEFLLLALDFYLGLKAHMLLLLLLALQQVAGISEFAIQSVDDIIDQFGSLFLGELSLFGIDFRQLEVEGEELPAFVVGLLTDVELEELSLDRLFLVDGVEVGVEVFQGAQVFVFDFGLHSSTSTGAFDIWSGWMCLKKSANLDLTLKAFM